MLHLVGCLYYLFRWCTVKQISDNEIYLLIKYLKSVLWRVAKRLSYTEDAQCLKVKQWLVSISSERWLTHNMKQLCRVSCVLNTMPHFSFSDESELQVQELLYKDNLQLCLCFVQIYVEFFCIVWTSQFTG